MMQTQMLNHFIGGEDAGGNRWRSVDIRHGPLNRFSNQVGYDSYNSR
jgi:hypothetical protein